MRSIRFERKYDYRRDSHNWQGIATSQPESSVTNDQWSCCDTCAWSFAKLGYLVISRKDVAEKHEAQNRKMPSKVLGPTREYRRRHKLEVYTSGGSTEEEILEISSLQNVKILVTPLGRNQFFFFLENLGKLNCVITKIFETPFRNSKKM